MKTISTLLMITLLSSVKVFAGPLDLINKGISIGRESCGSSTTPLIRKNFMCVMVYAVPGLPNSERTVEGFGLSENLCKLEARNRCERNHSGKGGWMYKSQCSNPNNTFTFEQKLMIDYGNGRIEDLNLSL